MDSLCKAAGAAAGVGVLVIASLFSTPETELRESVVAEVASCGSSGSQVECAVKLVDGTYGTSMGPVMAGQPVEVKPCILRPTSCVYPK
jgi:hypothetical protein